MLMLPCSEAINNLPEARGLSSQEKAAPSKTAATPAAAAAAATPAAGGAESESRSPSKAEQVCMRYNVSLDVAGCASR
jgi:3-oxoacyl-ACP reductase-like protein